MSIGELLYLPQAWPYLSIFTKITALVAAFLPYVFLYLACAADPGYVTPETHAYYMKLYPYDHALFHPGHECRTCRLLKPARSKHCSICKRCVAKSDHHCIFINSCVGYGNQQWFLLLLLSTAILTLYGGVLGIYLMGDRIRERQPLWSVWPPKGMKYSTYFLLLGWGIQGNPKLGSTTLLALFISPLVWGLTIYSFYLVYCGITTNESLKWSEWKEDMQDGYVFQRRLMPNRRIDVRKEPLSTRWPTEPNRILVATVDGRAPKPSSRVAGEGEWEPVWKIKDVDNLYDVGWWDNLMDVFVSDYDFGRRRSASAAGPRRYTNRATAILGHPQ
jgi:palmitoyltransferase ZDHHC4